MSHFTEWYQIEGSLDPDDVPDDVMADALDVCGGDDEAALALLEVAIDRGFKLADIVENELSEMFFGFWSSPAEFAEETQSELTRLENVPDIVRRNIDWDGVASDLASEGWGFIKLGGRRCLVISP